MESGRQQEWGGKGLGLPPEREEEASRELCSERQALMWPLCGEWPVEAQVETERWKAAGDCHERQRERREGREQTGGGGKLPQLSQVRGPHVPCVLTHLSLPESSSLSSTSPDNPRQHEQYSPAIVGAHWWLIALVAFALLLTEHHQRQRWLPPAAPTGSTCPSSQAYMVSALGGAAQDSPVDRVSLSNCPGGCLMQGRGLDQINGFLQLCLCCFSQRAGGGSPAPSHPLLPFHETMCEGTGSPNPGQATALCTPC